MSRWTTLTARVDGRIGRLTLEQPDQLNPLGTVPLAEIADAAASAREYLARRQA